MALIVPAEVAAADVEAALVEGAGELLESIRLFDLYTGEQIGAGKKSLAFALRFRAPDRTLTAEEAVAARDAAVAVASSATEPSSAACSAQRKTVASSGPARARDSPQLYGGRPALMRCMLLRSRAY